PRGRTVTVPPSSKLSSQSAATRPSIPPLAWCAAAMWMGVCGAEELSWRSPGRVGWVGGLGLLILMGLMLYLRAHACARTAAGILVVAGVTLGLCVGSLFWARVDADAGSLKTLSSGASAETVTDSVASRFGSSVRFRVLDGGAKGATCSAQLPKELDPSLCGEAFVVRASVDAPGIRDEWARRRHRAGDSGRIRVWSAARCASAVSLRGFVSPLRRRLVATVQGVPGDGGALLQGVLLGERSRVRGTPMESDFRTTGLSHLLAVSGTHLSIVAYLAGALLSRTSAPRNLRILMILLLAACYVLLTGAPVSSIRAFVMAITAGLSGLAGRRGDAISALCVAVCLVLCVSPAQAFDIGFALSVSAVGGLVIFAPLASGWLELVGGSRLGRPLAGVAAPLVAQASTAPIAIPAFNMFSLIAPVANVLVLPIASVGLGLGVAGVVALAASRSLGCWIFGVAAAVLGMVARVASLLASVPHAAIPLGGTAIYWGSLCAVAGAVLWALWPSPRAPRAARLVAAFVLACALAFAIGGVPGISECTVIALDVGQGDAILIKDGPHAVLVDTGPDASTMRAAAARVGMRDLDAVVLTHPHADHIGGLAGLQGVVTVRRIMVPASTASDFESIDQLAKPSQARHPRDSAPARSSLSGHGTARCCGQPRQYRASAVMTRVSSCACRT
ncbi:MAG: ComEC/Rec2 family competence protein, partial [Actinomycetota bacterium]|nr:ComEC/Rec2 family competence protein [Actinomycetota bacterium]